MRSEWMTGRGERASGGRRSKNDVAAWVRVAPSAAALVCGVVAAGSACTAVDDRQLDEVTAASGGTGGTPPLASPVAGSAGTPAEAPPPALAANGESCSDGGACESSRCEPTRDGPSVCCALDCAEDERCAPDGAACVPLPRAQGDDCGAELACGEGLACMPAAVGQSVCCAATCGAGEFCVDAGARCEAPLRALGAECTESGQCTSGYCDIDTRLCAADPCADKPAGSFCGRGAQCSAEGLCAFNAMGMVAAGSTHTCAILTSGAVRCWGDNRTGQLGVLPELDRVGDTPDEIPSQVPGLEVTFGSRHAVQVTAGVAHTCVLLDDGNVRCWTSSTEGQAVPARADGDIFLPSGERAVQIDAGGYHTCALLASGNVTCWGYNEVGQTGFGNNAVLENVELGTVALSEPAIQVTGGGAISCALLASGALTCWGSGQAGALGYGEQSDRFAPMGNVDLGAPAQYVSAGARATCAVITGGFVRCWGDNQAGILGYGHDEDIGLIQTPGQAVTLTAANGRPLGGNVQLGGGGVAQVEVNSDSGHVCARFSGGAVRCWGDNNGGSLGYGHEIDIGDDETPAQAAQIGPDRVGGDVPFGRSVLALAAGGRCAVLNDRSVMCWGRNSQGQLGIPSLFPDGTPTQAPDVLLSTGIGPVSIE